MSIILSLSEILDKIENLLKAKLPPFSKEEAHMNNILFSKMRFDI